MARCSHRQWPPLGVEQQRRPLRRQLRNWNADVANGGVVFVVGTTYVGGGSLLAIDVGRGSSLTVGGGTGTISNAGTVRLAGRGRRPGRATCTAQSQRIPGAVAGRIRRWAGLELGQLSVHRFGDAGRHAGTPVAIDLSQEQRVLVTAPRPALSSVRVSWRRRVQPRLLSQARSWAARCLRRSPASWGRVTR